MTDLRELAEQAWRGELDLQFEHHPVHTFYPGACELAPGLLAVKGIAGMYVFDTGDGLVLVDSGSVQDTKRLHAEVRQWRPDQPVVAVVYTHHHVDHVMGVFPFDQEAQDRDWPRPCVYAHETLPTHFERYEQTLGWNTAINRRQFRIDAPDFRWPSYYRYPDVVFKERLSFRHGDLTFQLRHGRGETDDATWVWVPEWRVLASGDMVIWAVPNAGNPQKVQRYVGDWAEALNHMATLDAEILLPGHGLPVFGGARIRELLTNTSEFLTKVEQQTLALMNQGCTLDECLHALKVAPELTEKPYLQPIYDDPSFLVRAVWRRFGGWWDGEFDTLIPAPRAELAHAWVELAGGVEPVLARVERLVVIGEFKLACHLVEATRYVAPNNTRVHELRAKVYRMAAERQSSSMARNLLHHAALASEQGRRDLASERHS